MNQTCKTSKESYQFYISNNSSLFQWGMAHRLELLLFDSMAIGLLRGINLLQKHGKAVYNRSTMYLTLPYHILYIEKNMKH